MRLIAGARQPMHSRNMPLEPEACANMQDVRAGVDALDEAIAPLIAKRQRYMDAAARIKPERSLVRDEARIAEVLAHVKAVGQQHGLSDDIAEAVWRAMIEACIAHEFAAFDRLRAQFSSHSFVIPDTPQA
jgi:isochorismate pyruvate lyase